MQSFLRLRLGNCGARRQLGPHRLSSAARGGCGWGRGGLSDTVIKPGSCFGGTEEEHFGGARGKIRGCQLAVCCPFSLPERQSFLAVPLGDQSSSPLANT